MSDTPTPYTTPACWCRNCDNAAKSGLSPLAALRLGSRFIVCPDCGNKRCPKGTNHELACTNSNESGQKGSEWESIKPWPKSAETIPAEAPAPALLSAERLAEIRHFLSLPNGCWHSPEYAEQAIQELLCAYDNQADTARELSYERQMRQQTEEAMVKLAQQVAGLKAELGEQEAGADIVSSVYEKAIRSLHARAEQAEALTAQVAGLKVELAEQERAKLLLIQETHRWSDAVKALEAERVAKPVQNDAYDDKGNCWQCGRFSTECNGWHD